MKEKGEERTKKNDNGSIKQKKKKKNEEMEGIANKKGR